MKRHSLLQRRAMTMPELLVASAVMSITTIATARFFGSETRFFQYSVSQSHVDSHVQIAVDSMTKELRNATRRAAGSPPNASLIAADQLRFYLPTDADGDGFITDATGDTEWDDATPIDYIYDADTQQLQRVAGGNTRVLATDVTAVQFDDQSSDNTLMLDEVRIQLTVQRITTRQDVVQSTSTAIVRLRN